ncbi:MAG: FAD-dependent oxidoreductase [Deltaproteobacteria bacterium]|nr:FAD-dependent oxidoreductase [Deltaproteobacteria bacterium]
MITFKLNGKEVQGEEGQYILQVAQKYGVDIPTLCYHKALDPAGMCRLCTVELFDGRRTRFVTACNYPIWEGMEVNTDTEAVHEGRRLIVELLLARCPDVPLLQDLGKEYGIEETRFKTEDDTCILCGLCVRMCEKMGNSAISLTGRGTDMKVDTPFHLQTDVCIACGACASVCPTGHITLEKIRQEVTKHDAAPIPAEFDMGLHGRKPIYVPFVQAIPNIPTIDASTCVHFKTGGCQVCTEFCDVNAIDYSQEDEIVELDVGSIILSPGFETFNAELKPEYGHGRYPNVMTSIEYERILSAGGPFQGHIIRPSDHQEPKKIAWIQCIGSRDAAIGCDYCSYVCCMYATKQAIISKDHDPEIEPTIFFIDIRAQGKGFDRYYERARSEVGVRYIRSMISRVVENPKTHNLEINYVDEADDIQTEEFDLVVLSVGLRPNPSTVTLAETLGIELNEFGFCETKPLDIVSTSKPGIFVSGVFQSPKDIPDTVIQASGAAAAATGIISEARGTLETSPILPEEKDISGEAPRIGVFVCHCGINIASVVDVKAVHQYAKTIDNVVFADDYLFTCSTDTQEEIKKVIQQENLNRVVIASCSPRTHEPLFQETLKEAGLNKYLFEMANIRDQDSWVHASDKAAATEKAKDLVRMSVARARKLKPLYEISMDITQKGLVIGGGLAGLTAALSLAEQGYETFLVEKSEKLGGNALTLHYTEDGSSPAEHVRELIQKVEEDSLITVYTHAEITGYSGVVGNFTCEVTVGGDKKEFSCGAIIVATGAKEHVPEAYLYGQDQRVVTQKELEQKLAAGDMQGVNRVVMIQCVGSRDDERPYCSRVCCTAAVKNALKIKALNPSTEVDVLYRDIRTFAFKEIYYKKAREQGVRFLRYDPSQAPEVKTDDDYLTVAVHDQNLHLDFDLKADVLALSAAIIPHPDSQAIAHTFKLPSDQDGFFMEAHLKLKPLDFAVSGIFLCGLAHGPKFADESIAQAKGAVSRACTILSKAQRMVGGAVANVDDEKCVRCLTCVRTCPFSVPIYNEKEGVVYIDPAACQACGNCATACPRGAIEVAHHTNEQYLEKICALF